MLTEMTPTYNANKSILTQRLLSHPFSQQTITFDHFEKHASLSCGLFYKSQMLSSRVSISVHSFGGQTHLTSLCQNLYLPLPPLKENEHPVSVWINTAFSFGYHFRHDAVKVKPLECVFRGRCDSCHERADIIVLFLFVSFFLTVQKN